VNMRTMHRSPSSPGLRAGCHPSPACLATDYPIPCPSRPIQANRGPGTTVLPQRGNSRCRCLLARELRLANPEVLPKQTKTKWNKLKQTRNLPPVTRLP
jgi:hypothetical protein